MTPDECKDSTNGAQGAHQVMTAQNNHSLWFLEV